MRRYFIDEERSDCSKRFVMVFHLEHILRCFVNLVFTVCHSKPSEKRGKPDCKDKQNINQALLSIWLRLRLLLLAPKAIASDCGETFWIDGRIMFLKLGNEIKVNTSSNFKFPVIRDPKRPILKASCAQIGPVGPPEQMHQSWLFWDGNHILNTEKCRSVCLSWMHGRYKKLKCDMEVLVM